MKGNSPLPTKYIPKPWGGKEPQDMFGLEGVLRLLSACHPKALFPLGSLGCMCSTVPSKFSGVNLRNPLWCFCCSKEGGLFNSLSASTAKWQFDFAAQHGICPWIAWKPPGVWESQFPTSSPTARGYSSLIAEQRLSCSSLSCCPQKKHIQSLPDPFSWCTSKNNYTIPLQQLTFMRPSM